MASIYLGFKAVHILAVISWMAGLLYLPRIFVYHAQCDQGSQQARTFATMERRLFGIIMTPAMIVTWLTGAGLVWVLGAGGVTGFAWFWIKICAVFILSLLHARFGWHARQFAIGLNQHSARYFRIINEIPAVLAVIAVIMVVMKPS